MDAVDLHKLVELADAPKSASPRSSDSELTLSAGIGFKSFQGPKNEEEPVDLSDFDDHTRVVPLELAHHTANKTLR